MDINFSFKERGNQMPKKICAVAALLAFIGSLSLWYFQKDLPKPTNRHEATIIFSHDSEGEGIIILTFFDGSRGFLYKRDVPRELWSRQLGSNKSVIRVEREGFLPDGREKIIISGTESRWSCALIAEMNYL
ncbi:MAG: hypothetical protein A2288_03635 [Candidatus Moranbacteria bacterium RIFOXYA12_FULL_44_15]|nr:MAG: hypothetical protein A2288_03635 [Candidatus Moranbacteria bacterium RIFOXYA12_FULL_44_15]OGI36466.1 MAG: hypothetical protein A2259_01955 [Candidatus Moranbacteria bacterium RIFOXYA2_FULL_43_15]